MKFGTGSTTELTQKREGQSTKMPYVRPNIYINKQTSPIFNCVTPVSVSLATFARQLEFHHVLKMLLQTCLVSISERPIFL